MPPCLLSHADVAFVAAPTKPRMARAYREDFHVRLTPLSCSAICRLLLFGMLFVLTDGTLWAAEVSFRREVMAVLSKAGCNMGACHGNANGKGGLQLSLRGQDPEFDYLALVRKADGRRIDRVVPTSSLLLLKPTGQLPHQGGRRFTSNSLEYQMLHDWLVGGAPGPQADEPAVVQLEVSPTDVILVGSQSELPLRVTARFVDGTQRDVTQLATYELSNQVAQVSAEGVVRRITFGETTVVARYLQLQVPVRVAFVADAEPFVWQGPVPNGRLDQLLFQRLRDLRVNPSPSAPDEQFVRRAFLDAIGVLPTAEEAREFVHSNDPHKRERLIDMLLGRPEFADHWALKWSDLLRVEEKVLDPRGVELFHGWIRDSLATNKPLDRFVRELLRGSGSTYQNPAANFWRANRDPATRGETTARLFLGARLQCAKCHNHPFDRWTQDDYYSWGALFGRIDYEIVNNERPDKLDKNEFNGEQIVNLDAGGGFADPRTGRFAAPKLLGDEVLGPGSYRDRLTPLAVWLTAPENRLFAQSQVNFVWYHLLGRGLVEPIDDFRATNPATHPEVLNWLADDFVQHRFDLRHLIRTIMTSRVYQLSAEPNATNQDYDSHFARAIITRLPAEKLLDAQVQVLGRPVDFAGFPRGRRATTLPGVQKANRKHTTPGDGDRFLAAFGKPERLLACECERSNETGLGQAFLLISGPLNEWLADPRNALSELNLAHADDASLVDELYWRTLSRAPRPKELQAAVAFLSEPIENTPSTEQNTAQPSDSGSADSRAAATQQSGGQVASPSHAPPPPGNETTTDNDHSTPNGVVPRDIRLLRLQDLAWALLNSKEFVFRH